MAWFRLFLRNGAQAIVGRSDFEADGNLSAVWIAHQIASDCSDYCASYDLLKDGHLLLSSNSLRVHDGVTFAELSEIEQQIVIDTEIALHDSKWAIKDSKRLLAALETREQSHKGTD